VCGSALGIVRQCVAVRVRQCVAVRTVERFTNLYCSIENDEGRCVIYTRKIMDGKYTYIGNNTRRVLRMTKEDAYGILGK
jgi:hypothetical protein